MLAQQVPRSHTLITVTACQFLVINAFNFVRTVDPALLGKLRQQAALLSRRTSRSSATNRSSARASTR